LALISFIPSNVQIIPTPIAGTHVNVVHSHNTLQRLGVNMHILITDFLPKNVTTEPKSIVVVGHFDTGANTTSIDFKIADMLGLVPMSFSTIRTANGAAETPNYIVNLSFPNTLLKPFEKLQVTSCDLEYDLNQKQSSKNLGILIGRDVMSRWNIVWNGPTSSVFISD